MFVWSSTGRDYCDNLIAERSSIWTCGLPFFFIEFCFVGRGDFDSYSGVLAGGGVLLGTMIRRRRLGLQGFLRFVDWKKEQETKLGGIVWC